VSVILDLTSGQTDTRTTAGEGLPNTNGNGHGTATLPDQRPSHRDPAPHLSAATVRRLTTAGTGALPEQEGRVDSYASDLLDPDAWASDASALSIGERGQFVRKQEWIGRVEQVLTDTFVARLRDVTDPLRDDELEEEAELYLDELSPADRRLVRPGAVFYWVIGYDDLPTGQRLSRSQLIFRHPRPLSDRERAAATARAEERWQRLTNRQDPASPQTNA
jgi:hypothetical protein